MDSRITKQIGQKNVRFFLLSSFIFRILHQEFFPIKIALLASSFAIIFFSVGIISGLLVNDNIKSAEIFVSSGTPSLVCEGTCYGNPDGCTKNCGKPCKQLTTTEITKNCGWGTADPKWVTYQCCNEEIALAPTPAPTPTPTPTSTPTPSPTVPFCDANCVSSSGICSYRGTDGLCHKGNNGISSTYWPGMQDRFCCQYTCYNPTSGQCKLSQLPKEKIPVSYSTTSQGSNYLYDGCKPVASTNSCGNGPDYNCTAKASYCRQGTSQTMSCNSISKSTNSIKRDQNITFTCQSNGINDVKANFKIMRESIVIQITTINTKDSTNKYSWIYTIPSNMVIGSYSVLCQVCDSTNNCSNWSR